MTLKCVILGFVLIGDIIFIKGLLPATVSPKTSSQCSLIVTFLIKLCSDSTFLSDYQLSEMGRTFDYPS